MAASPTFTLLTFNAYLFPLGLRHSFAYANKLQRANLIRDAMRRRPVLTRSAAEESAPFVTTALAYERSGQSQALTQRRSAAVSPIRPEGVQSRALTTAAAVASAAASQPPAASSDSSVPLLSADIVCLQEVLGAPWCNQWKTHFAELAKPTIDEPAEYDLVFSPPARVCSGMLVDSGLMIASRFPILHSNFQTYSVRPNIMRFADRGFLHAVLDVSHRVDEPASDASPRRIVHIVNTHLHPHEASDSVAHGDGVRRGQMQEIREYLLSTMDDTALAPEWRFSPSESALIVTGDLNTEQASEECLAIRRLLDCPNVSLIPSQEPTMHSSHPFCNHPPEQTICGDYAIANRRVKMSHGEIVRDAWHLSDHYPVRVEFSLTS